MGSVNFNWLDLLVFAHGGHWGLNLPPKNLANSHKTAHNFGVYIGF